MLRGQYVIVALLALGLAAALLAVGILRRQGARALEYWGPADALLIRDAESTELLTLDAPAADNLRGLESMTIAELREQAVAREQVRRRRGASHLWFALLRDESYHWTPPAEQAPEAQWDHALIFERSPAQPLVVLLDLDQGYLRAGDRPPVAIAPMLDLARQSLQTGTPATAGSGGSR